MIPIWLEKNLKAPTGPKSPGLIENSYPEHNTAGKISKITLPCPWDMSNTGLSRSGPHGASEVAVRYATQGTIN